MTDNNPIVLPWSREQRDEYLAAIVDSSDDAIFGRTLDGIVLSWNKGAERIYGFVAEDIIGHSVARLIPPGKHEELSFFLDRIKENQQVKNFETERVHTNGRHRFVSITVSPIIDRQGNVIGAATITRDITKRQILAQRKDEFNSLVAHEIRSPLAVIKAVADNLSAGIAGGPLGKEQLHYMHMIQANTERLNKIIGNLLELTRLESGKASIACEPVHVEPILQDMMREYTELSQDKPIAFELQSAAQLPPVLGDASLIRQVLTNLVNNACRFATTRVIVEAETIVQHGRTYVQIGIRDDGQGISAEHIKKLFAKFVQVTRPVSGSGYRGTGLGLALCKEIMQRLHGTISVESELGQWAQFTIRLPIDTSC